MTPPSKVKDERCRLCGRNCFESRSWLRRVSPTGGEPVWQCALGCESEALSNDDRVLRAIVDVEERAS